MAVELSKNYDWKEAEPRIQKMWAEKGTYKFNPGAKKIFKIDTPPPTVSGAMHIGHASSYSHMDFMARFKRMQGYSLFYPFGTDDNGLPTERLVEKLKNVKSTKMERREFVKLCLSTIEELRPDFVQDWKNIAISADWSLFYTTISPHVQKISQKSFLDLYRMGRGYRKEAPYIWCPTCQTAIAQIELEDKDTESTFNDLSFQISGGGEIIIATTRPEMLPACVAIFAHPDDKRYKHLKGKKAKVPVFNQEVPILFDGRVNPEKGTGIVMCCTFGDQTDIEWFKAYNLPLKVAITKDGHMTDIAGKYKGMKIKEARTAIIKDLKDTGILKDSKAIMHSVNVHDRCGTEIEILNTSQWFVKYLDMKKELLDAGRKIKWHPEFMRSRYENWINGLQWDWCISMQRYFGVPIPVWYCKKCGSIIVAEESQLPVDPISDTPLKKCECGSTDFIPDRDVMNTWATSSLTPQIAISLVKDEKVRKKLYPMDLRPQAHDIITFWLFNTVVKGLLHTKKVPWENAMISGYVLDPHGNKMSKSKGNVVSPKEVLAKYPADAFRFWASGSKLGEDLPYQEKDLVTGVKFITKLWNASKFAIMHIENYRPSGKEKLTPIDKWLISRMAKTIESATESFEDYNFSQAKRAVESFFWSDLCDNYLEIVKDRLYNQGQYSKEEIESARYTLYYSILTCLKLMAPVAPHITEEIYQMHFRSVEKSESIHISQWPKAEKKHIDSDSEEAGNIACSIIAAVRKYKSEKKVSMNMKVSEITISCTAETKNKIEKVIPDIKSTTKAEKISFASGGEIEIPEYKIRVGVEI